MREWEKVTEREDKTENNIQRGNNMKICIPSNGPEGLKSTIGQHFGKVAYYTIVDSETGDVEVVPNTSEHTGGMGLPPDQLSKVGVDIMLCGGLGRKAVQLFESHGIEVYVGAGGSVGDTFDAWKSGKLDKATMDNACAGHDH
jgi:predicted Fe-Mo cluster-binding NifX family protein